MSDPSLELQAAIVAALKNSPAVTALVGNRIYDAVPSNATFAYISLGDCQVLPDKADCLDGAEVFLQVDVWSRAVGYPESKTIAKAVVDKLDDQPLTVAGHDVVIFEHQSTQYLRDPDGLTRHAAVSMRALIYPT